MKHVSGVGPGRQRYTSDCPIAGPRRERREQVIQHGVEHLAVGTIGEVGVEAGAHGLAEEVGDDRPRVGVVGHVDPHSGGDLALHRTDRERHVGIDDLLRGQLREVRTLGTEAVDEPGDVRRIGPDRVLAVLVGGELEDLRVGGDDVVTLAERLHADLPVRRDLLGRPERAVTTGHVEVAVEVLDQLVGVGLERLWVLGHVDEHEALPRRDSGLGQTRVGLLPHLREVPLCRQLDEVAVEIPLPPVERAAERRHATVVGPQLRTAMQARVVERLDRSVLGAGHDQRLVGDVVHDVVARVLQVDLHARHLPRVGPEVLVLECGESGST